ncbi:hypothetical protein EWM64_g1412 [Hericium alpestre]|uniref:Uncharacterized protein n=1 Tax=Hericium alpestre TaxID=135208 RepID=A0A4Z0A6F9_9AGAM|nr:hypothetical protein EWM64_g1412 [Hericium alpestre]
MDSEGDWSTILNDHPIFSRSAGASTSIQDQASLELSTNTLRSFTDVNPEDESPAPSGRRQTMVVKDAELIVAVGKEIRVTGLGDTKLSQSSRKSYKVLYTPNVQFEIHQLALNPTGKLLAVAGAFQVAVVVLPRPGFTRLVPTTIDCKSIQVGQFYHASASSAPIARVEWHPWGDAGSTLVVVTMDGKLREYDISVDTEEPQQTVSFVPEEKKSKTFNATDASEREVASFCFGKGKADWGPLTVYAAMKSGDVYAICPYMPRNASIPSSYIHALDCFVAAKKEYLEQFNSSASTRSLSVTYDYQQKFVNALLKQLPPGSVFPSTSRSMPLHPPNTIKCPPMRQGPFLLQPSPRLIDGSDGADATDIIYLAFGNASDNSEDEGETERLGLLLLTFQDGKIDVCLDVDKVEALWETKQHPDEGLPMLAVYETIDLGLVSMLSATDPPLLDLLQANYQVFHADPIYDDTVYVYHAFGVHVLHFDVVLRHLASALHADQDGSGQSVAAALQVPVHTDVKPIVSTFSIARKATNPVVAVAVPNDVYLNYSIFILTSAMRVVSFTLNLRSDSPDFLPAGLPDEKEHEEHRLFKPVDGPTAYASFLGTKPFEQPPILSRSSSGLPSAPRLVGPGSQGSKDWRLTPDSLRYLYDTVERFSAQIHAEQMAYKEVLTKKANPELSEHETKWFDELKRIKQEALGAGRYDETSLTARTRLREYSRLMPHLKAAAEKDAAHARTDHERNQGLGVSQAFEFGQQFNKERLKIQKVERDLQQLAAKLEFTLSRPPPLRDAIRTDSPH